MKIYILFTLVVLATSTVNLLIKKLQLSIKLDATHFLCFQLLCGLFGCCYFLFASGFQIYINSLTLFFSIGYAVILVALSFMTFMAQSKMPLALVGIITSAGSIALPSLVGFLFLQENATWTTFLAIIVILIAATFPLMNTKEIRSNIPTSKTVWLVAILYFLFVGMEACCSKLYAITPGVSDTTSYCFLVNLLFVIPISVYLLIRALKSTPDARKALLRVFTKKQVGIIALQTGLSNIWSILMLLVLAEMPISIYTPLYSSSTLIIGMLISQYYFKEHITWKHRVSLVLAITAVVLLQL